ncbi:MAG: cytochrome ubiquinol oxidase subunit I [Alcaligenaceae bacterium]|nr:cytochrome ubiquinol oxidase subunit I [Alcaligenaceae bacterium]
MTHLALWISQAQFFMSLSFMLLFLLLEIGLAWALAFFRLRALGGEERWLQAYRFWVRIFALAFIVAFGAAVPVMIQFGSLWPMLMERIGNVAGPLLAVAVLSVFLFKSCFVGAMLFGQRHIAPRLHAALVVIVAVGVTLATLWPIMLFSWMRTPAGAVFSNGQYIVTDWSSVFFNPSFPWYASLLILLALATASLFMLGVAALQGLWRSLGEADRAVFNFSARAAVVSLLALAVVSILAARALAVHEPGRAAAAMGYWQSAGQPSVAILAVPDGQGAGDRWAWRWQGRGGGFLARDLDGGYRGLDQFSGMAPPRGLTFWTLRLAVLGTVMVLLAAALGWWRLRAHGGEPHALSRWLLHALVAAGFGGWWVAVLGFAHVIVGAYPYAVAGTVTLSEVLADVSVPILLAGGLALLLVYALCMAGFLQLLWHYVRYGVVPIARHRGRA